MRDYRIMGVVNVTPDSFSDGGRFFDPEAAIQHASALINEGADILDIGGESTRPGADAVSSADECRRVLPVLQGIKARHPDQAVSIDTSKTEVMRAALEQGADMINDVNALQASGAETLIAEAGVPVCLMHKQGDPKTMQLNPNYADVVGAVKDFFQRRIDACLSSGIKEEQIVLDPGFGFGKTLQHNMALMNALDEFKRMGFKTLVGVSMKSMIGDMTGRPVDQRLYGSLAAVQYAYLKGADIFRVHHVAATADVLAVSSMLKNHG